MKKTIVSLMMAVALVSGSAFAQTPNASTGATTQKEAVKGDKARKGPKGDRMQQFNPFDGVQLTNDQQAKLAELQKGLGPVQLTPEEQAKIKENPNLTPEQKKQLKEEKKAKKMEAKKNYLKGVKEILTPDQYVIFLENVYLYSPQQGQGQGHDKGVKPGKGGGRPGPKAGLKGGNGAKTKKSK